MSVKKGEVLEMVPAPRMPRREAWIDLPEEYAGFKVKVWVNPPAKLWAAVFSVGDNKQAAEEALRDIVLEHNGWMDTFGVALPPADTKEFWEEIPDELAAVIMTTAQLKIRELPNSLVPKNLR